MPSVDYSSLSTELYKVETPAKGVILVTLNRPKALNSIPRKHHFTLDQVWRTFEQDDSARVAIITGTGKVFSAGADLKEWLSANPENAGDENIRMLRAGGFMGISNRTTSKPIIVALNGSSFGGGTEALLNADLAVAVASAKISLPETRRGVIALAGALPRAGRILGIKRANELALLAEPISAQTALEWGLVNRVVERVEDVIPEALKLARTISLSSPDAISASLKIIRRGYENTKLTLAEATEQGSLIDFPKVMNGPNITEGLIAFNEKRAPNWHKTKL